MKMRWGIFFTGALISFSAWGYVPSADYVLDHWVKRTRNIKTLHVRLVTTVYDESLPEGSVKVEEEIWIERPLRYRRQSHFPNGVVNELVVPGQSVRVSPGGLERRPPLDLLGPLGVMWVAGSQERLESLLTQLNISFEAFRWTQRDGNIGYEIGSKTGPRLQFEKDAWLPQGAVLGDREVRFENSTLKSFPAPFPEVVEVWRNGKLKTRSETQSVKVGIPFKNSIFDLKALRSPTRTK